MTTRRTDSATRAPRQRRTLTSEPHAGVAFTSRGKLADAVRELCEYRLQRDHGLSWEKIGAHLTRSIRGTSHAPPRKPGAGRPPDVRARFVYRMERFDIVGAAGGPRGQVCSSPELAMFWLLAMGVGEVSAARIRAEITAADVIDSEAETMHKLQQRQGPDPWAPARETDAERKTDRVETAPNGQMVRMRSLRTRRGHRPE